MKKRRNCGWARRTFGSHPLGLRCEASGWSRRGHAAALVAEVDVDGVAGRVLGGVARLVDPVAQRHRQVVRSAQAQLRARVRRVVAQVLAVDEEEGQLAAAGGAADQHLQRVVGLPVVLVDDVEPAAADDVDVVLAVELLVRRERRRASAWASGCGWAWASGSPWRSERRPCPRRRIPAPLIRRDDEDQDHEQARHAGHAEHARSGWDRAAARAGDRLPGLGHRAAMLPARSGGPPLHIAKW